MKRLPGNPGKFDLVELFTAVSRQQGYRIDVASDVQAFKSGLDASLAEALGDVKLLDGKRVEAMFGHVAGARVGVDLLNRKTGERFSLIPALKTWRLLTGAS